MGKTLELARHAYSKLGDAHLNYTAQGLEVRHTTYLYVWHDSFLPVTLRIYIVDMIHMCDMTPSYVTWATGQRTPQLHCTRPWGSWLDSRARMTWLIHVCDMTHSYAFHDAFICVTWLVYMCDTTPSYMHWATYINYTAQSLEVRDMTQLYVWHHSFIYAHKQPGQHISELHCIESWSERHDSYTHVAWLVQMYDLIYSYAWRDSFICLTRANWAMHTSITLHRTLEYRDKPYLHVCRDSSTWVAWLMHMWDLISSCAWHDSFICLTWPMYMWHEQTGQRTPPWHYTELLDKVTRLIYTCGVTALHVWRDSYICVPWLIHMCDVTHFYVLHDSFTFLTRANVFTLISLHKALRSVTWLIYTCGMIHSYVWHDLFLRETWLIHMCDMTHLYVWHDFSICVTSKLGNLHLNSAALGPEVRVMTHLRVWHDSFMCDFFFCETWLIPMCDMTDYMCDMTFPYVCRVNCGICTLIALHRASRFVTWFYVHMSHALFICVTWCIHMCDMTHLHLRQDSCICATWLIHMCDMTRWHVWHASFTRATRPAPLTCVTWLILTCDMTHAHAWHDTFV